MRTATALPLLGWVLAAAGAAVAGEVPESLTGADLRAEHAGRRAAVAADLPKGTIAVIPAVASDPMALYAPRQEEDYRWLTGIEDANGILLLWPPPGPGKPHGEILFLPPRMPTMEVYVGPRLYPGDEARESTGVRAIEELRQALPFLEKRLEQAEAVFLRRRGGASEHAEKLFGEAIRKRKVETRDVGKVIAPHRLLKSPEEIARIRRSAERTAAGHVAAMRSARAGMPEFAVQAALEAACREGGCRRQAYDTIVGSGPNACVLHYSRNRRVLEEGDLVLVDGGGEFQGYACDVTRTWPVSARFTDEQAKAYDAVLAAQEAGIAAAKPGANFKAIEEACRKVLEERGYGAAIRHGPCHWVGLGVHDPNGDGGTPLRPGVVFVIEPGAYFPDRGFGIRIEDTFVMLPDGSLDNLSKDAPRERSEVERLRAEALAAGGK
jgi:Xaa-Pro aminopeptidase